MSRQTKSNQDYEIAYGHDHLCGLFVQIFERARANDEDEGLIVNLDNITPERLVAVAEEYGFALEHIMEL